MQEKDTQTPSLLDSLAFVNEVLFEKHCTLHGGKERGKGSVNTSSFSFLPISLHQSEKVCIFAAKKVAN